MSETRARRLNNPGNIRKGDPWQGLADVQNDESFCTFIAPRYGFRALAVTLTSYFDRYHLDCIREIITRWAPPVENNTAAYIQHVANLTGFSPDEALDLHDYRDMFGLCKAIATHESGAWCWDDNDLEAGIRGAGIEPPPTAFVSARGIPPKLAALGTVGGGTVLQMLHDARDQLAEYSYVMAWVPKILFALTAAIIVWEIYKHRQWTGQGLR